KRQEEQEVKFSRENNFIKNSYESEFKACYKKIESLESAHRKTLTDILGRMEVERGDRGEPNSTLAQIEQLGKDLEKLTIEPKSGKGEKKPETKEKREHQLMGDENSR